MHKLTPRNSRILVKELRTLWTRYQRQNISDDLFIERIEQLLYFTGVMQE